MAQLRACRGHCPENLAKCLVATSSHVLPCSLQLCQSCQRAGGCLEYWLTGTVGAGVALGLALEGNAPLATTATAAHRWVLCPADQRQCVALHGLPVRKGSLCSCWLLSVIALPCCCPRDRPVLLPEACGKTFSHLQHALLQADQLAKPPPLQSAIPRVEFAPGCWAVYSR